MLQNTFNPPPIKSLTTDFFGQTKMQQSIRMTADDCNSERNYLDSYFSFLKPLLEAFKFIYILKII